MTVHKKFFVKITKWGLNLGIRIPREVIKKQQFSNEEEILIFPLKDGFKVKKIAKKEAVDNYTI